MIFLKFLQFLKILNFSSKCIDKLETLLYYINIEKEINNKRNGVFTMTKQAIKENISMLAQSQGFYGRLLNQIEEDESVLDYLYEQSVQEGWKDAVDMVLAIEC